MEATTGELKKTTEEVEKLNSKNLTVVDCVRYNFDSNKIPYTTSGLKPKSGEPTTIRMNCSETPIDN
jgi:hypothetical protein